jgi:hypothetical protein
MTSKNIFDKIYNSALNSLSEDVQTTPIDNNTITVAKNVLTK